MGPPGRRGTMAVVLLDGDGPCPLPRLDRSSHPTSPAHLCCRLLECADLNGNTGRMSCMEFAGAGRCERLCRGRLTQEAGYAFRGGALGALTRPRSPLPLAV